MLLAPPAALQAGRRLPASNLGCLSPPPPNVRSSTNPSLKPPSSAPLRPIIRSSSVRCPFFRINCPRNACASSPTSSFSSCSENPLKVAGQDDHAPLRQSSNELFKRASLVGAAALTSKILGLVREIVLASVIGVGPVATAFHYAVVLPRFSSSFLGGVNGPIHITSASTMSKLSSARRRQLAQKAQLLMLLIGGVLAALTYLFAEHIILVFAPGLWILTNGQPVRAMAMTQLRLMIPCILVSGSLGIGFGCLTAEGEDLVPSLSPSLTSISIIISSIVYVLLKGSFYSSVDYALSGLFIACGTSVGSLLQFSAQVAIQQNTGCKSYSISWKDFFKNEHVHELFFLMIPATVSSGLSQIAALTDLYFSSYVPGAAAALSYAHLLAMAPMGILASIFVLPVLPMFSRQAERSLSPSLKEGLEKVVLLSMVVSLPVTCTICVLANPLVNMVFERFVFDSAASSFVSSLLVCYSVGSPFWILRDLFAAVCYYLGEGKWPFLISVAAIILNGLLDWLSISVLHFGARGLALSTSCVTLLSALALLHLLSKKLYGRDYFGEVINLLLLLLGYCIVSGSTTMISYKRLHGFLTSSSILNLFRLADLLSIFLAGFLGISAFYLLLVLLPVPGTEAVNHLLKTLINR